MILIYYYSWDVVNSKNAEIKTCLNHLLTCYISTVVSVTTRYLVSIRSQKHYLQKTQKQKQVNLSTENIQLSINHNDENVH